MQTVIFFLIMSIAWCLFYLYITFVGKLNPLERDMYFIVMHLYFVGYLLSRRMYLLKNEEKIKHILKARKLKKRLKKMRKSNESRYNKIT